LNNVIEKIAFKFQASISTAAANCNYISDQNDFVRQFYWFQNAGDNSTSTENISSRPRSIAKDNIHLEELGSC
tara:strand:+ start:479 stop:697 length:219 start_codon:yes stop_codon:yes gene_type:complete